MSYNEFIKKLDLLTELIEKECTGTALECAKKLNCSRRTFFNYLEILKEQGHDISFCRIRNTFFFDKKQ